MHDLERRQEILRTHGARGLILDELIDFNRSRLEPPSTPRPTGSAPAAFPLGDEPHLQAWRDYARDAERLGVWSALRPRFPQLQFPVRAGMSEDERYRRATRQGRFPTPDELQEELKLRCPESLELLLHPTLAGTVPVLSAAEREDFVTLVQAFTGRNEPRLVPDSQGACLVAGLNNWDRLHTYRRAWEAAAGSHREPGAWSVEFRRLVPHKELYQDRFIILSRGPYSGVKSADVGLAADAWLEQSGCIRLEHECTHYFTLRLFGRLQHNTLEELLADFVGIVRARGTFDARLALLFLGLERMPHFRPGGRLANYRGTLSDEAFAVEQRVTRSAVHNLDRLFAAQPGYAHDLERLARLVYAMAPLTLEELADENLPTRIGVLVAGSDPGP